MQSSCKLKRVGDELFTVISGFRSDIADTHPEAILYILHVDNFLFLILGGNTFNIEIQ